jgi:hypothetical protein
MTSTKRIQDREPYAAGYRLEVNEEFAKVVLPMGPVKWFLTLAFIAVFSLAPLVVMLVFSFGNDRVFFTFLLLGVPAVILCNALIFYLLRRQVNRPSPWTIDRKQGRLTLAGPPEETLSIDAIRGIRIEKEIFETSDSRTSVRTVYADLVGNSPDDDARVLGVFSWRGDAQRLGQQTAELLGTEFLPDGGRVGSNIDERFT